MAVDPATRDRLDSGEAASVLALHEEATACDGVEPLSEAALLALAPRPSRAGDIGPRHLLLRAGPGQQVLGYAQLGVAGSPATAELVVRPDARRRGLGRALLQAVEGAAPAGSLQVWAHGELPAAAALASSQGYRAVRTLWQMRRALNGFLPAAPLPEGVRLRSFRPGGDDDAWVALNARAFAEHPEQGSWQLSDLRARMAEDWFDADGFLVAEEVTPAGDGDPAMLGYHWTKVHPRDPADRQAPGDRQDPADEDSTAGPVGEVYVLGISPDAQGRGLGRALTLAGLEHLRRRGLDRVLLYVDADEVGPVRLYRGLGFERFSSDVMFARPS